MKKECIIVCIVILIINMINIGSAYDMKDWSECTWTNGEPEPTSNAPFLLPSIFFRNPTEIIQIGSCHWNYGKGTQSPGEISLSSEDGTRYGPWKTAGQDVKGVPNVWWWAFPNEIIQPDTFYLITDSDPDTWAENYSTKTGMMAVDYHVIDNSSEKYKLFIDVIQVPEEVDACGKKENIYVTWSGKAVYPVTLKLRLVSGSLLGRVPPEKSFDTNKNPLIWEGALSCCGYTHQDVQVDYELILFDKNGDESKPYPFSVVCKSAYT